MANEFLTVELNTESLRKCLQTIDSLPGRMKNKILKPAIYAGADMMRNAMVAAAPMSGVKWPTKQPKGKRPGKLKAGMAIAEMKKKRGRFGLRAGSFAGQQQQGEFYASFVEMGHAIGKASLELRRGLHHLKRGSVDILGNVLKLFNRGRKRGKFVLTDSRTRVEGLHFMEKTGRAKAAAASQTVIRRCQAELGKIMQGPPPPPGDA